MRLLSFLIFFAVHLTLSAQYKNDNVLYKTVQPQELCKALERNPGYLLLDVRSPGEFGDSSQSAGLNLGHLKGALNIDIRQVADRIREISSYRNKPVFVYCSHSQRSRRVSKMLADSGFTNVNNVNGGMTAIHLVDENQKTCLTAMMETANKYSVLSPKELCKKLSSGNDIYLLDVRTDSAWQHISGNPRWNAYGYIKGTNHIPLAQLKDRFSEIRKHTEIIITDISGGGDAALAANLLMKEGYDHVSILMEGMDRWLSYDHKDLACFTEKYVPAGAFKLMNTFEFARFYPSVKNYLLLDVRTNEDFAGNKKETWRNIGHIKNAVNIPANELEMRIGEIEKYKSLPVVLYSISGTPEVYTAADNLVARGFKNVSVLTGGLFNVRWTAANVPGLQHMHNWVEDVPEENR
jgi:rhodanese-related sulfurtransferase